MVDHLIHFFILYLFGYILKKKPKQISLASSTTTNKGRNANRLPLLPNQYHVFEPGRQERLDGVAVASLFTLANKNVMGAVKKK